jgi:hypothetical protein
MEADQNRFNKDGRLFETPESEEPRKKSKRKRSRRRRSSTELPIVETPVEKKVDEEDQEDKPQSNNIADEVAKVLDRVKQPKDKPETDAVVSPPLEVEGREFTDEKHPDYETEMAESPDFTIIEGEIYIRSQEDDNQEVTASNEGDIIQSSEPVYDAPRPESVDQPTNPQSVEAVANVPTVASVEQPERLQEPPSFIGPNYEQVTAVGSTGSIDPNLITNPNTVASSPNQRDYRPHLHQHGSSVPPLRPFGPNITSLNPDIRPVNDLESKLNNQSRQIRELEQARTGGDQETSTLKDQNDELREKIARLSTPAYSQEMHKPYMPEIAPIEPIDKLPPLDHHFEQSAWHTIEVDSKTGQAAEQPSFNYGSEFTHEQHQETIGSDDDEIAVASGQLAVVGTDANVSASQPTVASHSSSDESSIINQINPFKSTSQMNLRTDMWLWIILFLVVVADMAVILG